MSKRVYIAVCLFLILMSSFFANAMEVPHPTLNIPYLCTFGNESGKDWGDDDFSQTVFFVVPEKYTGPVYFRIFDPDVGGKIDEIQGQWNSTTRFQLFGGKGALTDPDSKNLDPEGNYKAGELIAEKIFGQDPATDGKWVLLAEVEPGQGEAVGNNFVFKLIIEGVNGNDGNLYKISCSTSPDGSDEALGDQLLPEIMSFSYEWSIRLPNVVGSFVYTFPFIVAPNTKYVLSNLWDFDNDNKIYLNTPSRPGLPVYSTGNNEWAITKYTFGAIEEKKLPVSSKPSSLKKRWFSTSYDILREDFEGPWTFQIQKGTFRNNDIVLNVTDLEGNSLPMYSTAIPRSGYAISIGGKTFEPKFITVDNILFIERDVLVNDDIVLARGSLLPAGTKLARRTKIPQDIVVRGRKIKAGTVLEEDVILDRSIILKDRMDLARGSVLVKDTQIAEKSVLYEGLAPGKAVLPSCNTVFLDSSGSTDPDGNPLTFNWDLGDGSKAFGSRVIHTYRQAGSYVVSVIATDDSGAINDAASKAITITINAPPLANAGENKWACVGERIGFDGSKSYDSDGYLAKFKWFFGDGFSSDGAAVSHVYQKPGVYSVRLDVADNSESVCNADSDGIVVIVNDPPVAKAGADISGCDQTVRFDGTASYDSDGKIVKYLWYFGDGGIGEGEKPVHTYAHPGIYKVRLVVSDDSESRCNTASDELAVFINAAPVAEAGPDRRYCVGDEVFFDGAASFDPNGDSLSYRWDFGDGAKASNKISPVHVYRKPGKYTVSLTLKDASGTPCATTRDTAVITVDTNPVAEAGPDQLVDVGQTITFDASGSKDPNGYPLTYNWSFGDLSEPAEGQTVTHVYNKPGKYRVLATATNTANRGCNTDSDYLTVTVNHPPIARAGVPVVTHAGADVVFDGQASFDPDGTIVSYEWDFGDKSQPVTSGKPKAVHAFMDPGKYTATLTVRDNTGLPGGVDKDTVRIVVNHPPKADAGEPMTVCTGQVIFDGSGSTDVDGNIIAYEWDFGDGSRGSGGRPVHIYKSPGVYQVTLTVTDNSGTATSKGSDSITLEINGPPTIVFGKEVQIACPGVPALFDASGSTDPNGDPITYAWDFGDGEKSTEAVVNHVYKHSGRYIASVTANDGRNMLCSTKTASKVVIVNEPPVADAGPDQLVNPNDDVSFNGSGSVDPDGKLQKFVWDFGDGSGVRGVSVTHSYKKPDKYRVSLQVTDNSGLPCDSASDEMFVTVNAPPVANAGPDQLQICSRTVKFDGTSSIDPDGTIVSFEWDFGDGSPVGVGPKPTHTYTKPGTYNVILKVTDDSNLVSGKSEDSMKVVINDPPVAKIDAAAILCPGESLKLSAKGSYDTDGVITAYEWDFGDGSPAAKGRNVSHSYKKSGKYTVVLTVTDNSGSECATGTAKQVVKVNTQPVAVAGDDIITCVRTTDCSFTLDAGQSTDADNDHLSYHWDFGDGTGRDGIRVQHEYVNPGTYTVLLTVTDDSETRCNRSTDSLQVIANAPPAVKLKQGD